ncbi:MAG: class I SAM-dependent methyltransferase [Kiritimatiellae bacterium]|nr:class I SAM-dependent methyltransferase [Kiritimatiellia bacterium]
MNDDTDTSSPFPETADVETSNDDYATRFRGATGAWMLKVQERAVLKLLGARVAPGATVLDVGGGHGQLAHPLADAGYKITVIGSAPSCRHRIADLVDAGRCAFDVGNVVALPYPDKSFDAVVAVRMLTHCSVWPTLVKEMCRVSRGPVITDYPTSQSLNAIAPMLFKAKKKFEKNTRTWTLFKHRQVRDAFADAGFRRTGRVGQFFLPMVVHRALKCKPVSAFLEGCCRCLGLSRLWGTPVVGRWERRP